MGNDILMIFLPGNVPSLKNGKPNGKYHSNSVRKYLQFIGVRSFSARNGVVNYKRRRNLFSITFDGQFKDVTYPVIIGFHFVRSSKRRFDFHNAVQIIADLLVAHRFIEDDNMDCMIPIPIKINDRWYSIDEQRPGVKIKVFQDWELPC